MLCFRDGAPHIGFRVRVQGFCFGFRVLGVGFILSPSNKLCSWDGAAAAGTTASAASATGGGNAHMGLIVGVAVGGCVLIGAALLALFLVLGRRRRERQRTLERLQHDPKFVDCTGKVCASVEFLVDTKAFQPFLILFGWHSNAPGNPLESLAVDRSLSSLTGGLGGFSSQSAIPEISLKCECVTQTQSNIVQSSFE